MEQFRKKLCETYSLSIEESDLLLSKMDSCIIPKKDFLVREGECNNKLYIIKRGVLRAFRNNDGEEIALWFAGLGEMIIPVWGYCLNGVSQHSIEAESEIDTYYITKQEIDKLCSESLQFANIIRKMFEHHSMIMENYLLFFADNQSAEERYLSLLKNHPELLNQVALKKLASFLFVTPQSLSRIRAGLRKKSK